MKFHRVLLFTTIQMDITPVGDDIHILMTGGNNHRIGCTAWSVPTPDTDPVECKTTVIKSDDMADESFCAYVAENIARQTGQRTLCTGGVYVENPDERQLLFQRSAAYFLLKAGLDVTLFDFASPLRTLLPTGGGRCNLAHAEYDFKELAKNYPRGEKFLYSVFSRFSTADTISLFEEMGVKTYTQENGRIFPESNSAKEVREKILKTIKKAEFIREKVTEVELAEGSFKIKTIHHKGREAQYFFPKVVVAIGGHSSLDIIKNLDIKIISPKPSLVGLNTDIKMPSGIVLKNVFQRFSIFLSFSLASIFQFKISLS